MSDGSAQDWIDDLTDPSDDGGDSPSLFEENFRKMVDDGDLGDMAVSTLENQVERIDDPSILSDAMDVDDRDEAQEIYQNRVAEINQDAQDDEPEEDSSDDAEDVDVEDADEDPDGGEDDADGGGEEEDQEETQDVDDIVGDLGGDDDEDEEPEDPQEKARNALGCTECDDIVKDEGEIVKPFDTVDGSVVCEECQEPPEDDAEEDEAEDDPEPSDSEDGSQDDAEDPDDASSGLPDVDVSSLAPDAISRQAAAEQEKQRTLLVWGPEGSGKSHIAHSAPEPICYIDTEGKADELAEKFDKTIHYWVADDYKEAKSALDQALDVLAEYLDHRVRGTLVVDSMTAMWEYAKVDYAKFAYQTENLSEVNFQSELEGEKDWTKIKARHNEEFRETILESPYHVVFTSGQKEEYGEVFDGGGKKWVPDGEKWNRYAVKDVVRLRRDDSGKTVADLRKAAKTRYSFAGLEWPTWDSIYEAIDEIYSAEQADTEIDISDWPFSVIDGQPVGNSPDGSDNSGDEEDEDDGD